MAAKSHARRPPVIIPPPAPSETAPATLIFIHGYNFFSSQFTQYPPKHLNVAHHIHKSPALQHVKIIIPEGLPSVHPSVKKTVWYDIPEPFPKPSNPEAAAQLVVSGHADNNAEDMEVSMDYFETLIKSEIANGTPASRIVFMGDSQGASMVVLFLLTRMVATELRAVISYGGFPAIDLRSVLKMQREHCPEGRWSKETSLFMLHGGRDVFVSLQVSHAWLAQLEGFRDRGQGIWRIEWKAIDGVEHVLIDLVWPHVRDILERVVRIQDTTLPFKL